MIFMYEYAIGLGDRFAPAKKALKKFAQVNTCVYICK